MGRNGGSSEREEVGLWEEINRVRIAGVGKMKRDLREKVGL